MVRLFVRFANWLNVHFPEKLEVTRASYDALATEVMLLTDRVAEFEKNHAATVDRVGRLESSAVHKGAVQDLVNVVKTLKDEQIAMKANLGWNHNPVGDNELRAMLNGEVISDGQ